MTQGRKFENSTCRSAPLMPCWANGQTFSSHMVLSADRQFAVSSFWRGGCGPVPTSDLRFASRSHLPSHQYGILTGLICTKKCRSLRVFRRGSKMHPDSSLQYHIFLQHLVP